MYAKKTTVVNKSGLHARPGSAFIREAKKFDSEITVKKLDDADNCLKSGSAKSLVQVMAMMLVKGTRIEICAEGSDETAAVDTLVELVDTGLAKIDEQN
jgi:phosphocarrier protein